MSKGALQRQSRTNLKRKEHEQLSIVCVCACVLSIFDFIIFIITEHDVVVTDVGIIMCVFAIYFEQCCIVYFDLIAFIITKR